MSRLNLNKDHIIPQLLLRSWPFPNGAGRILDRLFGGLRFSNDVAAVRTNDGIPLKVRPNDELVGRHVYLLGEFDRTIVRILLELSMPGDVLLDIGSNVGYVSASFLKHVPQSRVVAIEPQPKLFELLQSNLGQFGKDRFEAFNVAVSDVSQTGWLELDGQNLGASRVVGEQNARAIQVELWSAPRLFETLTAKKIDLVKIDVEGHEEAVLKACENDLRRLQPRAVLFEEQRGLAAPGAAIGVIFERLGYKIFGIKKYLTRFELAPIASASDCVYNDYVALHPSAPRLASIRA